jgi:hypothetical protein
MKLLRFSLLVAFLSTTANADHGDPYFDLGPILIPQNGLDFTANH